MSTNWVGELRKLIDLMKSCASEIKATAVKDGVDRYPSFSKLVDQMAEVPIICVTRFHFVNHASKCPFFVRGHASFHTHMY